MTPSSSSSSSQLSTFLQWLSSNNVHIDPRIQIVHTPKTGYTVQALSDIPYGVRVSKTPKSAVLSVRNCTLSDTLWPFLKPLEPNIALSIALLSEQLLGRDSRFWGYLQSLPEEADIALFWKLKGQDGEEALLWLQNTEVSAILRTSLLADLDRTYTQVVRPALAQWSPTIDRFRKAYSLVSSRAFQVDSWHGVGLVPVADAFNHSEENGVFMETDFAVCTQCGSLGPCAHPEHTPPHSSPWDEPMTCDMVTYAPLKAGEEVFNSYDEKGLGNAKLLVWYGFLLEGNGEDRIGFEREVEGVLRVGGGEGEGEGEWSGKRWEEVRDVAAGFGEELEELEAVVTPSEWVEVGEEEDETEPGSSWIDAEGRVSLALFLLLFARNSTEERDIATHLHLVISVMKLLDQPGEKETVLAGIPSAVLKTLKGVAKDVQRLCASKMENMYRPELTTSDLAAMLDTHLGPRTKLAVSYVVTERLMLETCSKRWQDLAESLNE
ncbi:SET domain-containing protein [Dacryopinax primogenitus]|uniref:SET domain-containing protein n=1 Tax=Dacryopinax primogenitus (strain DJM 731) TaxID=1858805 RepID=M5G0Y1_DACPD|nr:SET domain-containing protein [Dacryopinax primogenitus]EJU03906.1 SET domain-containing protein [Dacryopinax primogenitus]